MNSKFTLKVSVYEYFIKFGEQTLKQPFKQLFMKILFAYVICICHLHMSLVQIKKKKVKKVNMQRDMCSIVMMMMLMVMMMMMMMNCFCGMVDRRKAEPYFQPGPLSEILTIANLRHATNRI